MRPRRGFDLIPAPAMVVAGVVSATMASVMIFVLLTQNIRFPESAALMFVGAIGAVLVGGFILLAGYVYGDAQRRGMPAGAWTALVLLVPNCIGFVLYFLLRKPLLYACGNCGCGVETGSAFCPRCGQAQPQAQGLGPQGLRA